MEGGKAAATYPSEASQERTFETLIFRLTSANGSLSEAKARLGGFADRLSGAPPEAIKKDSSDKLPSPKAQSIEARLMSAIETTEMQSNELHSLIGRLERSL